MHRLRSFACRLSVPVAGGLALVLTGAAPLAAQAGHGGHAAAAAPRPTAADSAVLAVVTRYHDALAAGDSASALALLAPDAVVLESGGAETREEYRGHHLPSDIAYARAVPATRAVRQVRVHGATAWVSSTSVSQGTFNGRAVNSSGAELMVLTRGEDGRWRIAAIHWSSRTRRSPS